jgi:hypothetical protein
MEQRQQQRQRLRLDPLFQLPHTHTQSCMALEIRCPSGLDASGLTVGVVALGPAANDMTKKSLEQFRRESSDLALTSSPYTELVPGVAQSICNNSSRAHTRHARHIGPSK